MAQQRVRDYVEAFHVKAERSWPDAAQDLLHVARRVDDSIRHEIATDSLPLDTDIADHLDPRDVFVMLQYLMQSGPLAGSKPAYFKRTSDAVVRASHHVLCSMLELKFLCGSLSASQRERLGSWAIAASKSYDKRNA